MKLALPLLALLVAVAGLLACQARPLRQTSTCTDCAGGTCPVALAKADCIPPPPAARPTARPTAPAAIVRQTPTTPPPAPVDATVSVERSPFLTTTTAVTWTAEPTKRRPLFGRLWRWFRHRRGQ